jgi:hypothetical protein
MPFYDADEFVIQDALSSHAAHSTIQYLHDSCARIMEVSSTQCLDLNIMWNLWVDLKRGLSYVKSPTSEELWLHCQDVCRNIPNQIIKRLYYSIQTRIRKVIKNKDAAINY